MPFISVFYPQLYINFRCLFFGFLKTIWINFLHIFKRIKLIPISELFLQLFPLSRMVSPHVSQGLLFLVFRLTHESAVVSFLTSQTLVLSLYPLCFLHSTYYSLKINYSVYFLIILHTIKYALLEQKTWVFLWCKSR